MSCSRYDAGRVDASVGGSLRVHNPFKNRYRTHVTGASSGESEMWMIIATT